MIALSYEIVPLPGVGEALRRELYAIFSRCYDCVSWEQFSRDLEHKDWVIVLRDEQGAARGFSTQQLLLWNFKGEPVRMLFSGDTIIEPACWGTHELVKGWCAVAARALLLEPGRRLFWFLIAKGYRTYLYLPLFFREFYPSHSGEGVGEIHDLLNEVAAARFGAEYNAASGLVRFAHPMGQLTENLAQVPAGRLADPDARFFLTRNPGYKQGDELACMAEISIKNTRGIGRRWMQQAIQLAAADGALSFNE